MSPKKKKRRQTLRIAAYLLLALPVVGWVGSLGVDPDRDTTLIVSAVERARGSGYIFNEGAAYLYIEKGVGYSLTLCVRGLPRYAPADFVTVVRKPDGTMQVELLIPKGDGMHLGQEIVSGDALKSYLARIDLDYAPLDLAYRRYYGG